MGKIKPVVTHEMMRAINRWVAEWQQLTDAEKKWRTDQAIKAADRTR